MVTLSHAHLFFWSLEYDRKMLRYRIGKDRAHSCQQQDILAFACHPSKKEIWLCKSNRQIVAMKPQTGQLSETYGTVAFGVRAMAECPDDMNK